MKESYTISKYVNVWHCNEAVEKGELFMEAQMSPKIRVGKNLIVRTVELTPKERDIFRAKYIGEMLSGKLIKGD